MQIKEIILGSEPVTIEEAKNYLKIDFPEDDELIALLISATRQQMEQYTGLALIEKKIHYFDDQYQNRIRLPYPEHKTTGIIVAINGELATNYTKTGLTQIILNVMAIPNLTNDEYGIQIEYETTGNVPPAIKVEMLREIDEKYRNRGMTSDGSITELSANAYANLAKFCI